MNNQHNQARGQNFHALHQNWYEFPDSNENEAWTYTTEFTYAPGDVVEFHTNCSAEEYSIEILRDGAKPTTVYKTEALKGEYFDTPIDASVSGCNWPITHRWTLPDDIGSGGYLVLTRARNHADEPIEHQHFFVIRAANPGQSASTLFVLGTMTWMAYNNWGGSNHYEGNYNGPDENAMAPILSSQRPWAKGQVWAPVGAPRIPLEKSPEMGAIPRYTSVEWAYLHGYSKYYSAAGWASYERHFAVWAENNAYQLDYATQHDLHFRPELLEHYECVVIVGHDEYWTAEMRDAIDHYVDQGGNVARFAANFIWQVRLENNGQTQVCYKYLAQDHDPVMGGEQQGKLTTAWESPLVDRPGASTFGLNGFHCVYSGFGGWNPRNSGGYTVYRNDHWVFDGTDLYFGDTFGSSAKVFGFEVDGVDFSFRNGLPYPRFTDGAPESLEILAMNASGLEEENHGNKGTVMYAGDADVEFKVTELYGEDTPELRKNNQYGAGQMAVFTRHAGTVFNAGSCEWVNGLRLREPFTEKITQNVLNRFISPPQPQ